LLLHGKGWSSRKISRQIHISHVQILHIINQTKQAHINSTCETLRVLAKASDDAKTDKPFNIGIYLYQETGDIRGNMTVQKIIKTEEDYKLALSRIEKLMDASPETPEFDELLLLSTLVDIYEDKHYPISMPDPASAIRFRMEQQQGEGDERTGETTWKGV